MGPENPFSKVDFWFVLKIFFQTKEMNSRDQEKGHVQSSQEPKQMYQKLNMKPKDRTKLRSRLTCCASPSCNYRV